MRLPLSTRPGYIDLPLRVAPLPLQPALLGLFGSVPQGQVRALPTGRPLTPRAPVLALLVKRTTHRWLGFAWRTNSVVEGMQRRRRARAGDRARVLGATPEC